ncbi:FixH family protein [Methylorubrum extorquens]|uniref:YtkA-like domain-containing protein n=2 Tax=Methylorubrum extorquens TaxID=408 RepID=C7CF69_METED|nr:FixH family protein [Methylorubrum extorquens]EHP92720.1 hypothetical protein MetexDRAFT_2409 [Methylorubrum extorquens DSM 13060]CAX22961.1 protein of unknown function; putative membrane protein [Methylorubrum extorquens DM4]
MSSREEFPAALQEERRSAGRGTWLLLGLVLVMGFLGGAGAGYGLARGAWSVPGAVASWLPEPVAAWLPRRPPPTVSALEEYAFELLSPEAKSGEATLKVRLLDRRIAKTVADALIFASRLDMAPDGMPTMTGKLRPEASTEPGVYAFRANLSMEGRWRLSLAAKVPGETGTVQDQLSLKAVE